MKQRGWSHRWDGCEPPRHGEYCYCILLIGVRKKANWRPRTLDANVPAAFALGSMVDEWTRNSAAAAQNSLEFNRRQLELSRRNPKRRITIWSVVAYGCYGFCETVRPICKGGVQ